MSNICILCGNSQFTPVTHPTAGQTPYLECTNCTLWAQYPPPDFRWESELQANTGRDAMTEIAMGLNDDLASRLIERHKPRSILDIGTKYPYFLNRCIAHGVTDVLGIDGCPEIDGYGQELDVPIVVGNFLEHDFRNKQFDLITLIHCFEHFSDPVAALQKIKSILSEKGVVYIRTPENSQPGITSHLSDEHYQVHPVVFSKRSFRTLCQKLGFTVFDEWEQPITGQCDWMIRKADAVRISFAVISCNEEAVIGRMLDSITPLAWEVIVYLNNCTDRTPEIVREWSVRTGIKHRIIDGYWDYNFARAKNEAVFAAEGTHVAWMDCDDVLSPDAPEKILALLNDYPDHPQDWRLIYGSDTFFHLRLWKNEGRPFKPHFHDKCHEYVQLGGYGGMKIKCDYITLHHIPQPKDAAGRNIKILQEAKAQGEQPCPHCDGKLDGEGRTLFYLGNSLREAGRHSEALDCYNTYLKKNLGWHDERFWCWMYKGQDHEALAEECTQFGNLNGAANQRAEAMAAWCQAIAMNAHWAEPFLTIARAKYNEACRETDERRKKLKWRESIAWAMHAAAQPMPDTLMFLNTGAYKDQPYRLISWCWEHLGELDKALQFGEVASSKIDGLDFEWSNRLTSLRMRKGESGKTPDGKKIYQVMRPGALGDIVMSTAACKALKDAGYFVRYVCHPSSVDAIADNPFVDEVIAVTGNTWEKMVGSTDGLPKADKITMFQYPLDENYPETPMRQHLAHFFCEQVGVAPSTDLSIGLRKEHLDYGQEHGSGKIVIHTTAGWSPLKNWPVDRWARLVKALGTLGLEVVQIGSEKEATVLGATKLLTPSVRHAAAVQKFCKVFVGIDSVFNHTSQAVGKRSVILWGSTHPCGSGYDQNINLVNGKEWTREMGNGGPTKTCQPCYREYNNMSVHPKPPCPNLVMHSITTLPTTEYPANTLNECMSDNTVSSVFEAIKKLLAAEIQ